MLNDGSSSTGNGGYGDVKKKGEQGAKFRRGQTLVSYKARDKSDE